MLKMRNLLQVENIHFRKPSPLQWGHSIPQWTVLLLTLGKRINIDKYLFFQKWVFQTRYFKLDISIGSARKTDFYMFCSLAWNYSWLYKCIYIPIPIPILYYIYIFPVLIPIPIPIQFLYIFSLDLNSEILQRLIKWVTEKNQINMRWSNNIYFNWCKSRWPLHTCMYMQAHTHLCILSSNFGKNKKYVIVECGWTVIRETYLMNRLYKTVLNRTCI